MLSLKRSRLDKLNVSLKEKQTELETLCCQPDAAKKIEEIAAGIFRKNYKFVRQLEEFVQNVHHTGEQLDDLEIHLTRDKTNTHYRIICSDTLSNSKEAIFFDPQVIANCNAIKIQTNYHHENRLLSVSKAFILIKSCAVNVKSVIEKFSCIRSTCVDFGIIGMPC